MPFYKTFEQHLREQLDIEDGTESSDEYLSIDDIEDGTDEYVVPESEESIEIDDPYERAVAKFGK